MQMLLTGDLIDAATAIEWGLINDAVPLDELDAAVDALADRIAEASPMVLALGKRTFYEQVGMPQADAYTHRRQGDDGERRHRRRPRGHPGVPREATAHLDRPLTGGRPPHPRLRAARPRPALRDLPAHRRTPARTPPTWSVDPRLFGEIYAAPYGVLEPEHALVAGRRSRHARSATSLGALDTRGVRGAVRGGVVAAAARAPPDGHRRQRPRRAAHRDAPRRAHPAGRRRARRATRRTSTSTCSRRRRAPGGGAG